MGSGFLGLTLLSLMGHNGGSVLELSTSRTVLDNSTPTGVGPTELFGFCVFDGDKSTGFFYGN